ncbi:MAG: DUF1846 domain-containing protein [Bacteroidales bacterium]|jgi:uncharacterized protein (UPF0371 family)|nr:DUF1846 domain-containing protein [Bacteroidales bacterium]
MIGFDNNKYLEIQSQEIKKRISQYGNKLYLEFGGKLFDDNHASRVLPGFNPDSKLKMLLQLKDEAEIILVISALDIEKNKVRGDLGITYDEDVLRLKEEFENVGLFVSCVVITHYNGQSSVVNYKKKLQRLGIKVYFHYTIEGYPNNVALIDSEEGFGKNDYIKTSRPLVIVTAPGPGSGKMAVCLSQLYHENKRGNKAGYAKFETFPVWNLSLKHMVNVAYEAATADLNDVNMIDPYHLQAYGIAATNYNRDIEVFPVLNTIFESIYGQSPYKSPTDMGVNMLGFCISDEETCCEAAKEEIIRRYYDALCRLAKNGDNENEVNKISLILQQAKLTTEYRKTTVAAKQRKDQTNVHCSAIELKDGTIITAKTSSLLGPSAALIINATKYLAGIDHDVKLIPEEMIVPIQNTKVSLLHGKNPRLHTDEVLVAISMLSNQDINCKKALEQLPNLAGCQVHSTAMLSEIDRKIFKKLGVGLTCDPVKKG